ncbi:MAG: FtsH protease activity modulator HflK [Phycisphaerae bacterium]
MANTEFENAQEEFLQYWQRHRRVILAIAAVVIVVFEGFTMFYKVEADSKGVILRFGRYQATTGPGLHGKMPWPIDRVYRVPVTKVQSIEFGYRTEVPGRRTRFAPRTQESDRVSRMLTGDLNLAHVEWVVQYRVRDPKHYLFRIGGDPGQNASENARELISEVSEAVMRRIIGDVSVDSVITTGREQIAEDAKREMQAMLDSFEAGIDIRAVKLQSATPPDAVKDAFDEVNRAKQTKERLVNEAKGKRNRLLPARRGRRDQAILEAEGYALKVVQEAQGRAQAFLAQLKEYEQAPDITRERLYLEAMEQVLGQVGEKIIIDESVRGMLPLLSLDGEMGSITGRKGGAR